MTEPSASSRLIAAVAPTFLAIRDEYVAICNGDACAAALLDYFEGMTLYRRGQGYKESEWVYVEQVELPGKLRFAWGLTTIKRSLKWLRDEAKYLTHRKNPEYKRDQTLQYRFEVATVQAAVACWDAARVLLQWLSRYYQPVESQIRPLAKPNPTLPEAKNDFPSGQIRLLGKSETTTGEVKSGDSDLLEPTELSSPEPLPETDTTTTRAGATDCPAVEVPKDVVVVDPDDQFAWDAAFHQLQMQLDRGSFETWLRDAVLLRVTRFALDDNPTFPQPPSAPLFVIGVRNDAAREQCQYRLYRNIRRVLSDVRGGAAELRFDVVEKSGAALPVEPDAMPLYKLLAQQEGAAYSVRTIPATARQLVEGQIGTLSEVDAAVVEQIGAQYRIEQVREALGTLKVQQLRTAIGDPVGYLVGILRKQNGSVLKAAQ